MDHVLRATFSGSLGEVRRARQMVRAWLAEDPRCDDVVLTTSELVANGLSHGKGPIEVVLEAPGPDLVLRVQDAGSARTRPRVDRGPLDREGQRGLEIVEAISGDWGVDIDPTGTLVWARFPPIPCVTG